MTRQDDQLLSALQHALSRVDGDNPIATEAAKSSFIWRGLDAELASLTFDSAVSEVPGEPVLRSSTIRSRVLRFSNERVEIEIDYLDGRLIGLVTPLDGTAAVPASAELYESGASSPIQQPLEPTKTVSVGLDGSFVFSDLPPGAKLIVCHADDDSWLARTEWVMT